MLQESCFTAAIDAFKHSYLLFLVKLLLFPSFLQCIKYDDWTLNALSKDWGCVGVGGGYRCKDCAFLSAALSILLESNWRRSLVFKFDLELTFKDRILKWLFCRYHPMINVKLYLINPAILSIISLLGSIYTNALIRHMYYELFKVNTLLSPPRFYKRAPRHLCKDPSLNFRWSIVHGQRVIPPGPTLYTRRHSETTLTHV